ncbi:expressed unknown protein [Seminavis robusta]|uniref:Uncharacterized protein n=1 Tax=Seminavis robusta TaxID=568900 RepID=A0A9N8EH18_9STRA|nr:expressed unknown protein [Seminavis robusta]|eukprot:Sro937_g222160.1 n/a (99) ;mRNA; f:4329-4625
MNCSSDHHQQQQQPASITGLTFSAPLFLPSSSSTMVPLTLFSNDDGESRTAPKSPRESLASLQSIIQEALDLVDEDDLWDDDDDEADEGCMLTNIPSQ